ncbi:S-layer homology domain-containing protein [Cohnella rhizosphaerae]|uniref:S-layer homology domain-containing protein n=1 Tax=Cohnella rhizosphaerae TaxID=1457232 RepID=A0A9X4KRW2_9BACL|nr:S-layer homology domain-containing protein [Cohnella rhizosphaerae]MDG0809101.1 S-layer homology domain-containing protein [Cohnella rhizosphaerae]
MNLLGPAGPSASVSVTVTDYWQETVSAEAYPIDEGDQRVEVDLGILDKGHYTVSAQLSGTDVVKETYLSVVTPYASRQQLSDSPFAVDAAASLLVKPSQTEDFAKALQLSGVKWMRDRLHWASANSAPGVYDFSPFDPVNRAVTSKGIRTLDVYGDAPDWTHGPQDRLPDDLTAAYRFARDSADHFGSGVSAWEIWNEPDGGFTGVNETGDQYAAFMKAMAIGYRDSAAKPAVTVAGMAGVPDDYVQTVADNEVFPYADTYSFHAYPLPYGTYDTEVIPFPDNASKHLQFMDSNAAGNRNAWLTEAGITIPTGSLRELTAAEQQAQARYMATSAVQSLAAGVDKHFWFVMPYYLEQGNQYGMFSQNNAPYAAYQAIANVTDMLGQGLYAGQVQGLPEGAEGHLFDSGHGQVLVLWSERPATVEWASTGAAAQWFDLMGHGRTAETHEGKIAFEIGPDPIFIRKDERLSVPVASFSRVAKPVYEAPELTPAQRIVLAQNYEDEARSNAKLFGAYALKETGGNTIGLEIYNFNDTAMEGEIRGEASGGWVLDREVETVALAPGEKKTVAFSLQAGAQVRPMEKGKVSFRGSFGGDSTTVSAAYVFTGISRIQIDPLPGGGDPEQWDLQRTDAIAASGTGVIEAGSATGAVRYKYSFGETNQWAYPFLQVNGSTVFAGKSGIAFKVYAEADIPQTDLKLIVNEDNGSRYYTLNGFSIKAGWHTYIVPFRQLVLATFGPPDPNNRLDLDRLTSVQLGINTQLTDVPAFELADVGTYTIATEPGEPEEPGGPVDPGPPGDPGIPTGSGTVPQQTVAIERGTAVIGIATDSRGIAAGKLDAQQLTAAIGDGSAGTVRIEAKPDRQAKEIRLELPVGPMQTAKLANVETFVVDTGFASVSIRPDLLQGQPASGKLELRVSQVDTASLPESSRRKLGDSAAYEFHLLVNGTALNSFGGQVEVRMPYRLQADQKPGNVVVYLIDEAGGLRAVVNGKYQAQTGSAVFTPEHFSSYAAAYADISFADLAQSAWARDSIEALAARGIVQGTGGDRFEPSREVTRAEFVEMLVNAFEWENADANAAFQDVREEDWHYRSIASAHKLGIVSGKSDGTFGANEPITRLDMAVVLDRVYRLLEIEPGDGAGGASETFNDLGQAPGYAREAIERMRAAGLLDGVGPERFAPKLNANRAQAAAVIYRLFSRN